MTGLTTIDRIKKIRDFYKFKTVLQIIDKRLTWSTGIALDEKKNIYVSCQVENIIAKYDKNLNFVFQWGSFGKNEGQFNAPLGIYYFDKKLYVVERENKRIQVFDTVGNLLNIIDENSYKDINIDGIGQIAVLKEHYIVIVFYYKRLVYILDKNINLVKVHDFNNILEGSGYILTSLSYEKPNEYIYVGTNNGRIFKVDINNELEEMHDFDITRFLTIGMTDFFHYNNYLFVNDNKTDSIHKISKDGRHFKWKNRDNILNKFLFDKPNILYLTTGTYGSSPGTLKKIEI